MKIVILGAGQVGSSVAESLVSEQNDITRRRHRPGAAEGPAGQARPADRGRQRFAPAVLVDAGIEDADMLIAVTQQRRDQPRRLQGGREPVQHADPHRARPRSRSILARPRTARPTRASRWTMRSAPRTSSPNTSSSWSSFRRRCRCCEFADGRVSMVAVRAFEGGPLVGHPLQDLSKHMPNRGRARRRHLPRRPADHARRRDGGRGRRRGVLPRRHREHPPGDAGTAQAWTSRCSAS